MKWFKCKIVLIKSISYIVTPPLDKYRKSSVSKMATDASGSVGTMKMIFLSIRKIINNHLNKSCVAVSVYSNQPPQFVSCVSDWGDWPVVGDEVKVDPWHERSDHLQTLTGELWVGVLVGLQDLEPGLHQAGDALLPHAVFDQGVSTSLLTERFGTINQKSLSA